MLQQIPIKSATTSISYFMYMYVLHDSQLYFNRQYSDIHIKYIATCSSLWIVTKSMSRVNL